MIIGKIDQSVRSFSTKKGRENHKSMNSPVCISSCSGFTQRDAVLCHELNGTDSSTQREDSHKRVMLDELLEQVIEYVDVP